MGNTILGTEFEQLFSRVLTDPAFRQDLQSQGVGALRDYGLATDMPPDTEQQLNNIRQMALADRCGTCGVCGLCGFCAEVNLGSASAFLWATFSLGDTNLAAPTAV